MSRITRKELKSDKFAQDLGLTVSFFEEHRKEVVRYAGIALAVIALIVGYSVYRRHERNAREHELALAIAIQESPVSANGAAGPNSFPNQSSKDAAAIKAFSDLQSKYSGTDEGEIAEYYVGSILADAGKLADSEKHFLQVSQKAGVHYASLAKLALAQIYYADGRNEQGDQILRDLMAHPTIFVSKDEATITLARQLAGRNPAEARKLLGPIKDGTGPVATMAQMLYSELPPQ